MPENGANEYDRQGILQFIPPNLLNALNFMSVGLGSSLPIMYIVSFDEKLCSTVSFFILVYKRALVVNILIACVTGAL